jgi:hypothetical protein
MLAEKELVDVYFADEAGFSLTPYVPYGWQKIGEQVGIPTKKKQVANVLGHRGADYLIRSTNT